MGESWRESSRLISVIVLFILVIYMSLPLGGPPVAGLLGEGLPNRTAGIGIPWGSLGVPPYRTVRVAVAW